VAPSADGPDPAIAQAGDQPRSFLAFTWLHHFESVFLWDSRFRYLMLIARSEVNGQPYAAIAELDVLMDEKYGASLCLRAVDSRRTSKSHPSPFRSGLFALDPVELSRG
jgi:hypothetical protein